MNRDVVCQLPPEAGHPPHIAARLTKPAYGKNDAPRRWWNILDKALRSYGMVPTWSDRCCDVLYSLQSRKQAWEHWTQKTPSLNHVSDHIAGSPAAGNSGAGIINLFADDLVFLTGGHEMEQRVLARLSKIFQLVQRIETM